MIILQSNCFINNTMINKLGVSSEQTIPVALVRVLWSCKAVPRSNEMEAVLSYSIGQSCKII